MRQLQEVQTSPVDGVVLRVTDSLQEVELELRGPEETPFAGGTFHAMLIFDDNYPTAPPKAYFKTKIFHPNISERGEVCVNTLKKDWSAEVGVRHVLAVLRCLLIEPNAESALNEEAGRLLLENYQEYFKRAQLMTSIHAGGPSGAKATTDGTAASAGQPAGLRESAEGTNAAADKKAADRKKALKRL